MFYDVLIDAYDTITLFSIFLPNYVDLHNFCQVPLVNLMDLWLCDGAQI